MKPQLSRVSRKSLKPLTKIQTANIKTMVSSFGQIFQTKIKPKKYGFEPSFQVHHQEGQQNRALGCLGRLAHDPSQPESAFALAELAFDRVAVPLILIDLLFDFTIDFGLSGRSSQRTDGFLFPCKICGSPGFPRLIGRTCGWDMLTIRSAMRLVL